MGKLTGVPSVTGPGPLPHPPCPEVEKREISPPKTRICWPASWYRYFNTTPLRRDILMLHRVRDITDLRGVASVPQAVRVWI